MTSCSQWRDALIDTALGAPIEKVLQEHLEACPACAADLAVWRARAAEMDAKVREVAGGEPQPFGPERILAQIHSRRRRFSRARIAWALGTMACMALILYRPGRPRLDSPVNAMALSAWRSPTQSLLRSPADPLLNEVPRLGAGFYPTNLTGVKNAR